MNAPLPVPNTEPIEPFAGPLWQHPLLQPFVDASLPIWQRLPPLDDGNRWITLPIGERHYRFAQPITFTPYASWQPCSARCRFCSENLRQPGAALAASMLRPDVRYFDGLRESLQLLRTLPLSWSLSGLEASDNVDALLQLLDVLRAAEQAGQPVDQRVLYSNGAGFAGPRRAELVAALQAFGLSGLEFSRHHHDAAHNQAIMRFQPQHADLGNHVEAVLEALVDVLPVKLVCVVQRGGIDAIDGVGRYLEWARRLGVRTVIFRELARLDGDYRDNRTARYVRRQRVAVAALAAAVLDRRLRGLRVEAGTLGYYFSNLRCRSDDGMEVVFEAADYASMHARHDSTRIYKLIHFANGELAADWQPGRHTLWRSGVTA